MNKLLIIGGGVAFFLALAFGVYFFIRGDKPDDLITKKNILQSDLAVAEGKLSKEKETLNTLTKGLEDSFPLATSVQGQMKKSSDLVKQTDFMFTNPDGSSPELIVKNFPTSIFINNERRDINLMLSEWQKKINLLSVEEIDVNASEKIKQDVQAIESFIKNLSEVVKGLTPENSGLSQFQINIYSSQFPSPDVINEILTSIETAIENSTNNNSQTSNPGVNTQISTQTNNNQTSPNSPPGIPPVQPNDVIVQQTVVTHAQNQVVVLQEQLAQIEEQIQQSSPPPTDTTINSSTENQTTDNTNSEENLYTRKRTNDQGIIVQPGPPRLIQGTDAY